MDVSFSKDDDPHLVCSIFKQYLRDLPEPVIPYKYYQDFIQLFLQHEGNYNLIFILTKLIIYIYI